MIRSRISRMILLLLNASNLVRFYLIIYQVIDPFPVCLQGEPRAGKAVPQQYSREHSGHGGDVVTGRRFILFLSFFLFFFCPVQSSGAVHQLGLGKQKDSGFPQQLSERDTISSLVFLYFHPPFLVFIICCFC